MLIDKTKRIYCFLVKLRLFVKLKYIQNAWKDHISIIWKKITTISLFFSSRYSLSLYLEINCMMESKRSFEPSQLHLWILVYPEKCDECYEMVFLFQSGMKRNHYINGIVEDKMVFIHIYFEVFLWLCFHLYPKTLRSNE